MVKVIHIYLALAGLALQVSPGIRSPCKGANVTNAKAKGEKEIRFYNNDAGKFMVQMASQNAHADVVFMDPPRSGSTEEFMDAVAILNPDRVVYVSCNPETLARDLAYFKKKGYRTEKAWAVDQFPATSHVETVVGLHRTDM